MHEMLTVITDVYSVCLFVRLFVGSSRLYCTKMAKQIQMLFGMNTPGGPRNIVLDVGPDPLTERGRGLTFKCWDPPPISRTAEATALTFSVPMDGWEL